MFYLYIDEVLVSQSHDFNEIRTFIFNYYTDVVKFDSKKLNSIIGIKVLTVLSKELFLLLDGSLHGLILHQYDYFPYMGHEVQLYYGFQVE